MLPWATNSRTWALRTEAAKGREATFRVSVARRGNQPVLQVPTALTKVLQVFL